MSGVMACCRMGWDHAQPAAAARVGGRANKDMHVVKYAISMNKEIDRIAHPCGYRHARELRRETGHGGAFNMLYLYPKAKLDFRQPAVQSVI